MTRLAVDTFVPLADRTAEREAFAVTGDELVPLHRVVLFVLTDLVDASDADGFLEVEFLAVDEALQGVEFGLGRLTTLTEVNRVVEAVLGRLYAEPGVVLVDLHSSQCVGGTEGLQHFDDIEAEHRGVDLFVGLGVLPTLGEGLSQFDDDSFSKQFDNVLFHGMKKLVKYLRRGTAPRYSLGVGARRCTSRMNRYYRFLSHEHLFNVFTLSFVCILPTLCGAEIFSK